MRKSDQKEVEVEEELELFVENYRDECEDIVFLIPDYVRGKFALEFL